MITLAPCAAPPVAAQAGTWWRYDVRTERGNSVVGYTPGKKQDAHKRARAVERRLRACEEGTFGHFAGCRCAKCKIERSEEP